MWIKPEGKLAEWLTEKGDLNALDGFEVDRAEFDSLLEEAAVLHREYSEEEQRAWAAYSIRRRNHLPKADAEALGDAATREVNIYANKIEAQSRGFLALKTKVDQLCEAEQATLDYLQTDQAAHWTAIRDEIREQGQVATIQSERQFGSIIQEQRGIRKENDSRWAELISLWNLREVKDRTQMIWNWAWKAAILITLGLLAWQNAQAQVLEHVNIRQYNGTQVGAGNPVHVTCTSGCAGGTTDTDDGSVAGGQMTGLSIGLSYLWNGATWERASTTQPVSYGSGTFIVGDGAGALNVICDSGCAGGTQYTEGDVDATITGTAAMMEVAGNTLQPVQGTVADGLLVNLGANNDVTVTGNVSVIGTLTNNNAAPGANNLGVLPARATAADPSYTEGNQVLASVTLAGYTRVTCNNCGGSTFSDNSAFTFGTTNINIGGFVLDDTAPNAATENSAAAARISANRMQLTQIGDGAGNERRANVTAANALVVDGSAVTQPVSATDLDIRNLTATDTVTVTDGAGALNVIVDSGSITANAGTNLNTSLLALETTQGDNRTALQLIDNLPHARNAAFSNAAAIGCEMDETTPVAQTEGNVSPCRSNAQRSIYTVIRDSAGNERGVNVNASNELLTSAAVTSIAAGDNNIGNMDVLSVIPGTGVTNLGKAEDQASADLDVGVLAMARRTASPANTSGADLDYETLQINAGRLWTSATIDAALPTGSNTIGSIANITTAVTPGTAAANLGKAEDAAHGSGDAGVAIWGVRNDADTTPTEWTTADAEYTPIAVDSFGGMSGTIWHPWGWSYHENSSSALTDTTVHASCGTGLFNYISTIVVSTGAATAFNFFIEDSTTTTILGPYYLEAVAGRGVVINFQPAKKQSTAATLISITTSAAINHSIDIMGFCGR